MKRPFVLYDRKKSNGAVKAKKRLVAPMRDQATQCEWLVKPTSSSPESALGVAVLQRAVLDLITPGVHKNDKQNAADWLSGSFGDQHERDYPLSFTRIVEAITDINVDEFRTRVLSFAENAQLQEGVADGFRFQRS